MPRLRKLLILIYLLALSAIVHAATFQLEDFVLGQGVETAMPALRISGPIKVGDAAKLRQLIYSERNSMRHRIYLLLDSPGGNLSEAIAMAKLIRFIGFNTIVDEHSSCTSACFVLYAAGYLRMGQQPLIRSSAEVTMIGVHRALLPVAEMRALSFEEAREVVKEAGELSTKALFDLDVPGDIIRLVQGTPAAGMRYLTVEQLNTFFDSPWLIDLAHAKCGLPIPAASASQQVATQYSLRIHECMAKVLFDHRLELFPR